ncbi:helix-turn-helix domain-containing protein [Clostridium neuense]|uniref:Helix-turn-helix domain-containing protein n=1 Tax=Clostridium neuense TaxID=1728934 RepID=A0ABW8TDR8_9CLOT
MEILSVGEKIKRARIYKRLTLKDICNEKISVSKMSCIENGKIAPDDYILEFISKKLDVSLEYLKYDTKNQFIDNLKKFNEIDDSKKEEYLKYNMYYAKQYNYYEIAFEFVHILFNYYLDNNNISLTRELSSEYYDICRKSQKITDNITYYMDMGRYLFFSSEYSQSANYYRIIIDYIEQNKIKKNNIKIKAFYYEAQSYIMMGDYSKAYKIACKLTGYLSEVSDDLVKAKIYNILLFLSVKMDDINFFKYEREGEKYFETNSKVKAQFMYNHGLRLLREDKIDKAKELICGSMKLFPNEGNKKYSYFITDLINDLINSKDVTKYEDLCDEILNYSININNYLIIENAYYLKAKIFDKIGNKISFEMCMSLSLDFLLKLNNNERLYNRYLEMGKMYADLNNIHESIKYFNLAIKLRKKI